MIHILSVLCILLGITCCLLGWCLRNANINLDIMKDSREYWKDKHDSLKDQINQLLEAL